MNHCQHCGSSLTDEAKFCLACGKPVADANLPTTRDFFKEFINYDPYIWRTLKRLLVNPGKLTHDFINGSQQVTSPAKLFLILSAIAFLVGIFSVIESDNQKQNEALPRTEGERPPISLSIETKTGIQINNIAYYRDEIDSLGAYQFLIGRGLEPGNLRFWTIQQTIKKYQKNDYRELNENYERNASFLLYLLIPVFAFFMKVFRWKRSFTEHITFTLYFFCTFYLTGITTNVLARIIPIPFFGILFIPATIIYLIVSLRGNYKYGWGKATAIGLLTGILLLISLILLLFFSSLLIVAL